VRILGYHQVNLWSISYGTRLALTVMRLSPSEVRSVVLDSTSPTTGRHRHRLPGRDPESV
jgi:pimeloyl-ACP methyl ester carboxylesterase